MAIIPPEWRTTFGGNSMIAYNCCTSISSRTSYGPAAFAFDPNNMGTVSPNSTTYPSTPAKSVPLLYYDEGHQTIGDANGVYDGVKIFFNATVVPSARGLVIPDGSRSALYFQGQGMGPSPPVYGGTDCQNQHGYTNAPYHMLILAYDLNDWAGTAQNIANKPAYSNVPYAAWDLSALNAYPMFGNSKDCQGNGGGAVYDPVNQIIYWSSVKADPTSPYTGGPIIHVWKLNSSAPAPTTPMAPINFRVM